MAGILASYCFTVVLGRHHVWITQYGVDHCDATSGSIEGHCDKLHLMPTALPLIEAESTCGGHYGLGFMIAVDLMKHPLGRTASLAGLLASYCFLVAHIAYTMSRILNMVWTIVMPLLAA